MESRRGPPPTESGGNELSAGRAAASTGGIELSARRTSTGAGRVELSAGAAGGGRAVRAPGRRCDAKSSGISAAAGRAAAVGPALLSGVYRDLEGRAGKAGGNCSQLPAGGGF